MSLPSPLSPAPEGDLEPHPVPLTRAIQHRPWFSPAGLRRGLILAGFAVAAWSGWALGFVQGMASPDPSEDQEWVLSHPAEPVPSADAVNVHRHHAHHPQAKAAGV